MRVQHTVNPKLSEDTAGDDCLLGFSDAAQVVTLDGFASATSDARNLLLADGEFTLPLTAITDVKGFWVRSSGDFDVSINGGALIRVERGYVDATTRASSSRVLLEALVTDVKITPVADQRVHWAAWGDPT